MWGPSGHSQIKLCNWTPCRESSSNQRDAIIHLSWPCLSGVWYPSSYLLFPTPPTFQIPAMMAPTAFKLNFIELEGDCASTPEPSEQERPPNGHSGTTLGFAAPSTHHELWSLPHSHQIQPHWGNFIVLLGSKRKEYIKSAIFLWNQQFPNSGVHQNHLGSFFKAQGLSPTYLQGWRLSSAIRDPGVYKSLIVCTKVWEQRTKLILTFNFVLCVVCTYTQEKHKKLPDDF